MPLKREQQSDLARRRVSIDEGARPEHSIVPYVLDRQLVAIWPKRKLATDFGQLLMAKNWMYVTVVIDLFSREVVGRFMRSSMIIVPVVGALTMALWRRGKPTQVLHHPDQVCQHTIDFQTLLTEQEITCSMSRKGDCSNNSAIESFFAMLKTEWKSRKKPPDARCTSGRCVRLH